MTVVQRIEGPVPPVDLTERLTRVMNDTEAYLVTMRHDREQRSETHSIRQQQDVAYEESLRQDQEKVGESDKLLCLLLHLLRILALQQYPLWYY